MSGIYSDPRYEALGLTDTTQARAADQFYGSVPMAMGPMGGYGGQMGGFQDEEDLQVAYEQDIVRRLGQIDPTTPDYEFKVQEFFANEPDPNAVNYARVKIAGNALLGRAELLKKNAQERLSLQKDAKKREIDLRAQLAENGFDPQRFREITDANGSLKMDDAYYQLGQLKRTNGVSGKYNPASLTAQENEELIKAVAPLNIEPTDEEKVLAWQQATGSSDRPQNTKDWQDAYGYVKNPRIAQAQGLIRTYQQLGRQVPAGILSQAGIQPSVVSSTPTAQSNPQAAPVAPEAAEVVADTQITDVTPTGVTQRTRADVMMEEEAMQRMTPEQRLAANAQASTDEARRARQQEAATLQSNLDASVPLWESAKQELLSQFQNRPELLSFGRTETANLATALGKDPKATAFTDRTGQSWTWNDVTSELLNDPRVDNIRRGVAPGNQVANIKRITPK